MLKSTLLLILLSIAGNGCSPLPDVDVCIVNAPNQNRKCYNLKNDYNSDGTLRADAKPVYRSNVTVLDLNKALVIDSPHDESHPNPVHFEDGIARLKAWIKKLREEQTE